NLLLLNEVDRFHDIVQLLQLFARRLVSGFFAARDVLFAVACDEIDRFRLALGDFQQVVRDVLFTQLFGILLNALGFAAHFHDERAVTELLAVDWILNVSVDRHLILLGNLRLLVGIDKLVRDHVVLGAVQFQKIAIGYVLAAAVKRFDVQILLDLIRNLDRFVRQAVNLLRGKIHTLLVLRAQIIDEPQDSYKQDDGSRRIDSTARPSSTKP